jgi:hypothetical protein
VKDGSIITFHDSLKAENNVLNALPRVIDHLLEEGYTFRKIEFPGLKPIKSATVQEKFQEIRNNINKLIKRA